MAWDTADKINKVVDETISLIRANSAILGGLLDVYERDEEPAVPAYDHLLPVAYVIPIMEGGDHITSTIDATAAYHEFPITVLAYYESENINDLRPVRGYGYTAYDIIRQHNWGIIGPFAGLVEADLDVGYWTSVDMLVQFFILKFMFKSLF